MATSKKRIVYIGDERWRITCNSRMPTKYGECDYGAKTIRICSTVSGVDYLNTLIHEIIHARWPDLNEEAVTEVADTLSGIIDAEGFRQRDDHEE